MLAAGPSSAVAQAGLKQSAPATAPAPGKRKQLNGSFTPSRPKALTSSSSSRDRKQLQRKWFSKHAEKIGLQRRENERLIQKLQDKINRAASRERHEDAQDDSDGSPHRAPIPFGSLPQVAGAAPLVVLERKLHAARKQQRELEAQDLTRIDVVVAKLMQLSAHLDADVTVVARIAAQEGSVLLQPPEEVHERLRMLRLALNMSADQALELAAQTPELLTSRISRLAQALPNTAALFKSRGLPLPLIASARPDILLYSPETLMAKIDALPAILELSPRRARDLIVAWPALLRHSTHALQERYQTLVKLFRGLPRTFVAELLATTPQLLAYSPTSLRGKFAALVSKYGAFEDDVVDMVLVDPLVLINAKPLRTPPLRTPLSPPKGRVLQAAGGRAAGPALVPPPPRPPAAASSVGGLPRASPDAAAAGMAAMGVRAAPGSPSPPPQPPAVPPRALQPKMQLQSLELPDVPRPQLQQQQQQQQQQQPGLAGSAVAPQAQQPPPQPPPQRQSLPLLQPQGAVPSQVDRLIGPVRPTMPPSDEQGSGGGGETGLDGSQGDAQAIMQGALGAGSAGGVGQGLPPSGAAAPAARLASSAAVSAGPLNTAGGLLAAGVPRAGSSRVRLVKGKGGRVRMRRLPMKRGTRGKGRGSASGNRKRGLQRGGGGSESGSDGPTGSSSTREQRVGGLLLGRCKSVVDVLIKLAAVAQVPLYDVLRLCAVDPALGAAGPKGLRKRVQAIQQVLGLERPDTLALVGRLPGLLAIPPHTLAMRAGTLVQMLQGVLPTATKQQQQQQQQQQGQGQGQGAAKQQPATATSSWPAAADQLSKGARTKRPVAASPPAAPLTPAAQTLLLRHPELLLQDARTIEDKLVGLQAVLGVPLQRLLVVLGSHPQLILGPTHRVVDQLQALADLLGGRPLALVAELAIREPGLLAQPMEALVQRFDAIAASFGSFRDDAADVVLADPSMLMPTEVGPWGDTADGSGGEGDGWRQQGPGFATARGLSSWADSGATDRMAGLQGGGKRARRAGGEGGRSGGPGQAPSSSGGGSGKGVGVGQGARQTDDAQAIAAAALDEIIKAESQGANRTRRSRSRKQKE